MCNLGDSLLRRRGDDDVEAPGDVGLRHWRVHAAKVVQQLKSRLARELTEDKLLNYMIEWCDTPKSITPGCCYEDCCMIYPEGGVASQAGAVKDR